MNGPPLFNISTRIWSGRKHIVTHKLGIKPGSPVPKPNALPTKPPLFLSARDYSQYSAQDVHISALQE